MTEVQEDAPGSWKGPIVQAVVALLVAASIAVYFSVPTLRWRSELAKVSRQFSKPDSVEFRNVHRSTDGKSVCGQARGFNDAESYAGYNAFAATPEFVVVDDGKAQTATIIANFCP